MKHCIPEELDRLVPQTVGPLHFLAVDDQTGRPEQSNLGLTRAGGGGPIDRRYRMEKLWGRSVRSGEPQQGGERGVRTACGDPCQKGNNGTEYPEPDRRQGLPGPFFDELDDGLFSQVAVAVRLKGVGLQENGLPGIL